MNARRLLERLIGGFQSLDNRLFVGLGGLKQTNDPRSGTNARGKDCEIVGRSGRHKCDFNALALNSADAAAPKLFQRPFHIRKTHRTWAVR